MLQDLNYISKYYNLPKWRSNNHPVYPWYKLNGYHFIGKINIRKFNKMISVFNKNRLPLDNTNLFLNALFHILSYEK